MSSLQVGQHLGSYEIVALVGKGGMGEVYRAHDAKLKRDVAIKILTEEFSNDPERVNRFQREAEALAALSHQNIAGIYDFQQSGTTRLLVLEFVEGDTLADILKRRGALPIDEASDIARQICEALEAAHEKNIVHRDLKPGNVKITPDGKVKVLDFGLAKAMESHAANPALSNSPTLSLLATNAGVVLGTASYMSPEQARGRAVDRRSDIFAFGCLFYEMLTGRPAFDGEDVTEILGRVVTAEIDWGRLPAAIPASIQRLLRRALKKDPRHRLSDIRDARLEIEEAATEAKIASAPVSARSPRLAWVTLLAIAAAVIVTLAIPTARHLREGLAQEMRLEITTPSTSAPTAFALSPDGHSIVFVASGDGPQRLWVRALDKTEARPLAGTEGADLPFWSPDSRSIGFFASNNMYRIDLAGGAPRVLANAIAGRSGTWNRDGTILFSRSLADPFMRMSASGGEPVAVTRLDTRQFGHRFPHFLPDGRRYLFYVTGTADAAGIYLASLDGEEPKRLTTADSQGEFLKPDLIAFVRQGVLVARRLDVSRRELIGEPVILADSVGADAASGLGAFSVSNDLIAYRTGSAGRTQLTWVDRTGKAVGIVGEATNIVYPELSPDGRRISVTRPGTSTNLDIWLLDVMRGNLTPFTFDAANESVSVWSPDGTSIVFNSNRTGMFDLYQKPSSGTGSEEVFLTTANIKVPQGWSKDGRFFLYYEVDPKTGRDLKVLELNGKERRSRVVANTPFDETTAEFSPDGRWVAYQTDESKRFEVVVQPFPDASAKWQVSTNGGVQPRWSADGKELYFIAADGKLMAVPIMASGVAFETGKPIALFQPRMVSTTATINRPQYAVSRDGRFLINQRVEESTSSPITLILNWRDR